MHRLISMLVLLLCLMPLTIHGETMIMGTYEQDNHPENGPEPISWIILDRQEDRMLLLSEYALDCRQYHVKYNNQTFYENCALRSWLNDTFYMEAFSSEERTRILQTTLANHRKKG